MAKSCKVGEAGGIFGAYNRIHGQIVKICRDLFPSDWLQEIGHCVLFECPHRDFGVGQPSGLLLQPQALRASAEIGRSAADMTNPSIRIQKISGSIITTSLSSLTGIMVNKGNHPQMAELFRLVNYYNLPRNIDYRQNKHKTTYKRETTNS